MIKFISFACVVLLVGCGLTNDAIDQMNSSPRINNIESDSVVAFVDSIKINSSYTRRYDIEVSVSDENDNITSFSYDLLSGVGQLYQNNRRIQSNEVDFNNDILSVEYQPQSIGTHNLVLRVEDSFGETAGVEIELIAYRNVAPVSILQYNKLGINSKYEYELIGSDSYDKDSHFGGKIVNYEYTFQNKLINTELDKIVHIFPGELDDSTNLYEVKLRVQDDSGDWSGYSTVVIDITK